MIRRGMQPHKTKIATICHLNDCDFISYSKRDLNPHSRNGQGILSPSCLPIPPFEHPRRERAENETRTRDPNLGKVMLYQLSYFRVYGCKCREFYNKLQTFLPFSLQKNIFYRPKRLFSACSTAEKLNPFDISSIKPTILSLHKLPILPAWV